jgi:hypothetical protein
MIGRTLVNNAFLLGVLLVSPTSFSAEIRIKDFKVDDIYQENNHAFGYSPKTTPTQFQEGPQGNEIGTSQSQEKSNCYGYLTELVRSSNFPFKYVSKEKTNLLIDNDTGASVMAQLFFDTDGTGTIGWVQYDVIQRQLFNVSGDVEEPQELTFDASFAAEYETCVGR